MHLFICMLSVYVYTQTHYLFWITHRLPYWKLDTWKVSTFQLQPFFSYLHIKERSWNCFESGKIVWAFSFFITQKLFNIFFSNFAKKKKSPLGWNQAWKVSPQRANFLESCKKMKTVVYNRTFFMHVNT